MSRIILGCMRLADKTPEEVNRLVHVALDQGITLFDHADIYGGGRCEELFGEALQHDASIPRDRIQIQSKCCICRDAQGRQYYDASKAHILASVETSLRRMHTDYLDILLLHRPDPLVLPEEVAEAFEQLHRSGKVRRFGVSNHRPSQIELLKRSVAQPLEINQLRFSLTHAGMIAAGVETNTVSETAADRDGNMLDYCRLQGISIQAWSPFQRPDGRGSFIGDPAYSALNDKLSEIAANYGVSKTTVAAAWILRHPVGMQIVAGTTQESHLAEICQAERIELTRSEWYQLYVSAGYAVL